MKVSKLLTVLLFSFFIVGYLACKKTDSLPKMNSIQPEKLFVLPSNATSPIKKIVQTIEKQNAAHPFIETFIKKEGMPIWDKSSVFLSSNNKSSRNGGFSTDTIVLVPVAKESDSIVKSFLACNVNADTVLIRLIRDWEYKNYSFENREDTMTANALALQMMSFQKNVFGDSVFYIKDSRLFNYKNALGAVIKPERITIRSSSKSARQANNAMFISWVECVPVVYDGDQGNLVGVAPGGSNDYPGEIGTVCYYNSIWIDDSGGGGTVGGGDPIGGSGGGGGSSWYDGGTDPCAGSTTPTPIPRLSTAAPVDGCGSGWTPVTPPTYTSTLPPYIINDLTNPCLNKILIRLSGGTQNTFFKQIYNVFDASTNLQMSFRQGSLANINAYGLCNYIPSSSIGPIADITLDADVLMKCSQEWMAYVFIHEVAHAGMKANIITWNPNSTEHENMITTYLNQMATNLTSAFPNLSKFDAYAMCYTGFNNAIDGDTPNSIFMDIMLKQIRKILNDYTITTQQLIDRGDQFTDIGSQGTRTNCN